MPLSDQTIALLYSMTTSLFIMDLMSIRNFRDIREIGTRHIDLAKTRVQELMFHKRIVDSSGETQLAATANESPMKVLSWIQVGLHSMNQSQLELVALSTRVRNLAPSQF